MHQSSVPLGVAASQDQDFGTANLHVEVSDVVSVLVYVGVAKGNGVLSKTGKTEVGHRVNDKLVIGAVGHSFLLC